MTTPRHLKTTSLAALLLGCFAAPNAGAIVTYPGDPGTLGDPASWRTAEFLRDWGLRAIGAEYAYAAGVSGYEINVGMVDSGYFNLHPKLPPSRYQGVTVDGVPGIFNQLYNDTHGTHVAGTIGAARDGGTATTNFHGVAFNANVYVGNTKKTDSVLYGIPQTGQSVVQTIDNAYVADVYRGVNAQGVRIIGTSFGSQPNTEQYQTLYPTTGTGLTGRAGLYGAQAYLVGMTGTDTWFQGALDAAATGTLIAFSAGNGGYANPSPRAAQPYFDPGLESNWLAVAAIRTTGQTFNADGSINIPGTQLYNQCGVAKWTCVTAPGNAINGSTVTVTNGVPSATYASLSGTSMAQPHATGALAVLMERFGYMSNEQVLDVLKTTAVQNATINNSAGIAVANPNAGKIVEVPDDRNGWGTVSLRNAVNGPGQFTGRFAVDTQGHSDTWSNNISDVAIRARRAEDQAEADAWAARKVEMGWQSGLPQDATTDQKVEYATGVAREAARNARVYAGSLDKLGAGTLVLSGNNSYTGGTVLHGGTLVAASATAFGNGNVSTFGGTLAVRSADALRIDGDLTLGAAGALDLALGSGFGLQLDIAGHASFAGLLGVSFLDGFVFSGPATYSLAHFGGGSNGTFSGYAFDGLAAGYFAGVSFTSDSMMLNIAAVPEPETWALLLSGIGVVGWTARRRRRAD